MKIFSSFLLMLCLVLGISTDISQPVKLMSAKASVPSISPTTMPILSLSQMCSISCFGLGLQPITGKTVEGCNSNCNSLGAITQIVCNVLYTDKSSQYNCLTNKIQTATKAYVQNSASTTAITSLINDLNLDMNNFVNRNK